MNLVAELPAFIAALLAVGHDVRQVVYALGTWNPTPRNVTVAGHRIRLSGYAAQDPHTISLVMSPGWDYLNLVVIPPDTDALSARRAMDLAGRNGDGRRPGEILTLSRQRSLATSLARGIDTFSLANWETDGGVGAPAPS